MDESTLKAIISGLVLEIDSLKARIHRLEHDGHITRERLLLLDVSRVFEEDKPDPRQIN